MAGTIISGNKKSLIKEMKSEGVVNEKELADALARLKKELSNNTGNTTVYNQKITELNNQLNTVKKNLDTAINNINTNKNDITVLKQYPNILILLVGKVDTLARRIDELESSLNKLSAKVDTEITNLKNKDTELLNKIEEVSRSIIAPPAKTVDYRYHPNNTRYNRDTLTYEGLSSPSLLVPIMYNRVTVLYITMISTEIPPRNPITITLREYNSGTNTATGRYWTLQIVGRYYFEQNLLPKDIVLEPGKVLVINSNKAQSISCTITCRIDN